MIPQVRGYTGRNGHGYRRLVLIGASPHGRGPERLQLLRYLRRWVRFAIDSPLEEAGFEPSVPRDTAQVSRGAHVLIPLTGNFGANGNQHPDHDGRLARYRRFESGFLQRRVWCELRGRLRRENFERRHSRMHPSPLGRSLAGTVFYRDVTPGLPPRNIREHDEYSNLTLLCEGRGLGASDLLDNRPVRLLPESCAGRQCRFPASSKASRTLFGSSPTTRPLRMS
jgi:hypothetical protein